jgi:NitT/TauT family transport system permease protein
MTSMNRLLAPVLAFLACLALWACVVRVFSFSPLVLPSPAAVAGALVRNAPSLAWNASVTFLEAFTGFLCALVVALSLAFLFHFSPLLEHSLYPYAITLKSIPLIALAPLVVVWFGTGFASKVALAAVISFFPILVNAVQGLAAVEQDAHDLFTSLSASRWQRLTKLELPTALPFVISGAKVAATFAVVGAVVAEFIGARSGIGFIVKTSSYYLDTDQTFAAIVVAALTGLSLFGLVTLAERYLLFWQPDNDGRAAER